MDRKTKLLAFRTSPEQNQVLRELAQSRRMTLSEVIRRAVDRVTARPDLLDDKK